jgi:hypothetical protein
MAQFIPYATDSKITTTAVLNFMEQFSETFAKISAHQPETGELYLLLTKIADTLHQNKDIHLQDKHDLLGTTLLLMSYRLQDAFKTETNKDLKNQIKEIAMALKDKFIVSSEVKNFKELINQHQTALSHSIQRALLIIANIELDASLVKKTTLDIQEMEKLLVKATSTVAPVISSSEAICAQIEKMQVSHNKKQFNEVIEEINNIRDEKELGKQKVENAQRNKLIDLKLNAIENSAKKQFNEVINEMDMNAEGGLLGQALYKALIDADDDMTAKANVQTPETPAPAVQSTGYSLLSYFNPFAYFGSWSTTSPEANSADQPSTPSLTK